MKIDFGSAIIFLIIGGCVFDAYSTHEKELAMIEKGMKPEVNTVTAKAKATIGDVTDDIKDNTPWLEKSGADKYFTFKEHNVYEGVYVICLDGYEFYTTGSSARTGITQKWTWDGYANALKPVECIDKPVKVVKDEN